MSHAGDSDLRLSFGQKVRVLMRDGALKSRGGGPYLPPGHVGGPTW